MGRGLETYMASKADSVFKAVPSLFESSGSVLIVPNRFRDGWGSSGMAWYSYCTDPEVLNSLFSREKKLEKWIRYRLQPLVKPFCVLQPRPLLIFC